MSPPSYLRPGRRLHIGICGIVLGVAAGAACVNVAALRQFVWHPVPLNEVRDVVALRTSVRKLRLFDLGLAPSEVTDIGDHVPALMAVGGMRQTQVTLANGTDPKRVDATLVVGDLFQVLGARAQVGRLFTPEEGQVNRAPVLVLASGFWRREFGGDSSVIGRVLALDGMQFTIVGVVEDSHEWPSRTDVFVPHPIDPNFRQHRNTQNVFAIGRLASGASLESAQAAVDLEVSRWHSEFTMYSDLQHLLRVERLVDYSAGSLRPALRLLTAAVVLLLVIAVANIGGLNLIDGSRRAGEAAVQIALGASPARVLRTRLSEAGAVFALSAVVTLTTAQVALAALRAWNERTRLLPTEVALDTSDLLGALILAAAAVTLSTLVPWHATIRAAPRTILSGNSRTLSVSRSQGRALDALVVSQVALTMALAATAARMVVEFRYLLARETGFEADGLVTARLALPRVKYRDPGRQSAVVEELVRRLAASPGVSAVGVGAYIPFGGSSDSSPFEIIGAPASAITPHAELQAVSEGYFRTLRMPLRAGRVFAATDAQSTPPVVVVDEAFAKRFFPTQMPIGQRIRIQGAEVTIVGVVGSALNASLVKSFAPTVYFPFAQRSFVSTPGLFVRTAMKAALARSLILRAVREIDRDVPVYDVAMMRERVRGSLAIQEVAGGILTAFGAVALLLSALGLFIVVLFRVQMRGQEYAIRSALGATPSRLAAELLRTAGTMVFLGLVAGSATFLLLSPRISAITGGGQNLDFEVATLTGLFVASVGLLAIVGPMLQLARSNPARALNA